MEYLAKKPFVVVFVITLSFIFLLDFVINIENSIISKGISASLAVILSPRKKKIKTQTEEKIQITWVFLKTPIYLN